MARKPFDHPHALTFKSVDEIGGDGKLLTVLEVGTDLQITDDLGSDLKSLAAAVTSYMDHAGVRMVRVIRTK